MALAAPFVVATNRFDHVLTVRFPARRSVRVTLVEAGVFGCRQAVDVARKISERLLDAGLVLASRPPTMMLLQVIGHVDS